MARRLRFRVARWRPALVLLLLAATVVAVPGASQAEESCQGRPATIVVSGGSGRVNGTNGDDVIVAGRGQHQIFARGGNDIVCAGPGRDEVHGGEGDDILVGGGGADLLRGGNGADQLIGGDGPDRLLGGEGDDIVDGGKGQDTIHGGRDDDLLDGGSGPDDIHGGSGEDELLGRDGRDSLSGGSGADLLDGGNGRDMLNGGRDDDICLNGEEVTRCESDEPPPDGADVVIDDDLAQLGASVVVAGTTEADTAVRVTGGALPVTISTNEAGRFEVSVALSIGTNDLTVTEVRTGGFSTVSITRDDGVGTVTGRVVDAATNAPIPAATVTVDGASVQSGADGTFEISGPAEGTAVALVEAANHLGGLGTGPMTGGQGSTGDIPLVALAAGQTVGPEGGTLQGEGWSLTVPAGAVAGPTEIQVTALPFTGPKDAAFGSPAFDLSPRGLTFSEPVSFTFDNPLPETTSGPVILTGLDPSTLAERTHPATMAAGRITVALSEFEGEELRIDTPANEWILGPQNQWGGPAAFCQPFASQVTAERATLYLRNTLLPFLASPAGPGGWNADMWGIYLDGGASAPVTDIPAGIVNDFTDSAMVTPTLEDGFQTVLNRLQPSYLAQRPMNGAALPIPPPGDLGTDFVFPIQDLDPGETTAPQPPAQPRVLGPGQVENSYNRPFTPPGNAAGGTGSYVINGEETLDFREFDGLLDLEATVDARGVVRSAILVSSAVSYRVHDAIDLCPGDPGTGLEKHATTPLSRLESTPYEAGGRPTWASATPFEVGPVDLPPARFSGFQISVFAAHFNDADRDGWPETDPYFGAGYDIDNCPNDANPSQEDTDEDGEGDACDPFLCDEGVGDVCELNTLTSEFLSMTATGPFSSPGSIGTVKIAPKVPACVSTLGQWDWTPGKCYHSVDFLQFGRCVYLDEDTLIFNEIACNSIYSEPPGWLEPPVTLESDTYEPLNPPPQPRCGASGNFVVYFYGGNALDSLHRWTSRGPSALECRIIWQAEQPDALLGPTWIEVYGILRGPLESTDSMSEGFNGRVNGWIPITGGLLDE